MFRSDCCRSEIINHVAGPRHVTYQVFCRRYERNHPSPVKALTSLEHIRQMRVLLALREIAEELRLAIGLTKPVETEFLLYYLRSGGRAE